jgi:hypothetical protein
LTRRLGLLAAREDRARKTLARVRLLRDPLRAEFRARAEGVAEKQHAYRRRKGDEEQELATPFHSLLGYLVEPQMLD